MAHWLIRRGALGLALMAHSLLAFADEKGPAPLWKLGMDGSIWLITKVAIAVNDEVTDGCLPNPGRLRDKAELALRQNGFSVASEKDYIGPDLYISAIGYTTSPATCAVWISGELRTMGLAMVPHAEHRGTNNHTLIVQRSTLGGYILTGSKNDMQARLEKHAKDLAEELYLRVSRARDRIQREYPDILEAVRSQMRQSSN